MSADVSGILYSIAGITKKSLMSTPRQGEQCYLSSYEEEKLPYEANQRALMQPHVFAKKKCFPLSCFCRKLKHACDPCTVLLFGYYSKHEILYHNPLHHHKVSWLFNEGVNKRCGVYNI